MTLTNVTSASEWQNILSSTSVVITDFYADWCGPCKMIAPIYESLAKEHARPGKVAFCKVNVDSLTSVARAHNVAAMPTFIVFHNGTEINTLKGADPRALRQAVLDGVKLAGSGGAPGASFSTPGRTLGGPGPSGAGPVAGVGGMGGGFDVGRLVRVLVAFVGLYFVSLFSVRLFTRLFSWLSGSSGKSAFAA